MYPIISHTKIPVNLDRITRWLYTHPMQPSQYRESGFWITVAILTLALVGLFLEVRIQLLLVQITSEHPPRVVGAQIVAPSSSPTDATPATPEPYAGAAWEPTPYSAEIESTCQATSVYGRPDTSAIPLYTLPENSYVVPREHFNGWTMIQPAHWIKTSALCGD